MDAIFSENLTSNPTLWTDYGQAKEVLETIQTHLLNCQTEISPEAADLVVKINSAFSKSFAQGRSNPGERRKIASDALSEMIKNNQISIDPSTKLIKYPNNSGEMALIDMSDLPNDPVGKYILAVAQESHKLVRLIKLKNQPAFNPPAQSDPETEDNLAGTIIITLVEAISEAES